jgi:hypothetical protein
MGGSARVGESSSVSVCFGASDDLQPFEDFEDFLNLQKSGCILASVE